MDHQEALRTSIKNSQFIIYEEAGHAIHWEEPEKFAGDLVKFVKSHTENPRE